MSIFDEAAPPAPPPLPGGSAEKKSLSGSRLPGMGKPLLNKDIDRDIWGTVATSADVSSSSTLPREPIASPRRPESRGARNTEEIVAEVEEAVALIRGKNSSGTGFVVLPGIIATNSHVIDSEEIKDLSVHFPSETGAKKGPFTAQLLYEDPKRDLAFLEIPSKDHLPLSIIRDYNFRRGQKVIVVGNPGRGDGAVLENAVTEGILSTQTEMDDLPFYQLSIAINSGNSGGPVFNDEGDVLGVVTLKSAKAEAMAYCIPPDALNEAIEAVQNRNPADLQKVREQHASLVYLNRGLERLQVLSEVPAGKVPLFAREAIRDLDEAVHRLPDNAIAYFARALFKAVTDDMDGALADLDKAVDLAPDKPEIRELRDLARNERNRRNQMPSGQLISRYQVTMVTPDGRRVMPTPRVPMPRMPTPPTLQMPTTMPQLPPMLPPPGGVRPRGMSPSERALGRDRYQQVVNKELWTFNGTPLRGKLVGYKEGIAQFKLSDAAESGKPVERYANRFSHEDIEDIRFYARYHGIPIGNLQKR